MVYAVRVTKSDGSEESILITMDKYDPGVTISNLEIVSVDLADLANSPLRKLKIDGTNITEIDLTPLQSCANLDHITLENTLLTSLDLSPLSNCANLCFLYLELNPLEEIDLAPLRNLDRLLTVVLSGIKEEVLLGATRWVDRSKVRGNGKRTLLQIDTIIKKLDVSSLFDCPNLLELLVHEDTMLTARQELSQRDFIPKGLQMHLDRIHFYS